MIETKTIKSVPKLKDENMETPVERAVLMCGGKGSRMNLPFRGAREKPLVRVCGLRLVDHTLRALEEVGLEVTALASPNTLETERYLSSLGVDVVTASGSGYVGDLIWYLRTHRIAFPVLVLSADLIFQKNVLWQVLEAYGRCETPALSCVKEGKHVGINVVDGYISTITDFQEETVVEVDGVFNVNTREDVFEVEKNLNFLK